MKQIDHWYNKPIVWKRIALLLSIILYWLWYDCIILKYFAVYIKLIGDNRLLACVTIPLFTLVIFMLITVVSMTILGWILQGDNDYFFDKLEKWLTKIF